MTHDLPTGGDGKISHRTLEWVLSKERGYVRSGVALACLCELNLDTVDAVDRIDEENQDEDEGNLETILELCDDGVLGDEAIWAMLLAALACSKRADAAVWGGAGSYVNSFLLTVKGRGMIRTMNRAISDMRRRKTCMKISSQ